MRGGGGGGAGAGEAVPVATRATVRSLGAVVVVVDSVVRTVSRKRHRVNGGGELCRVKSMLPSKKYREH